MPARVAIHIDENGNMAVYADGDVEVFSVYDPTPNDRVYRYDPQPIPGGMIGDEVGFLGDGSPGEAKLRAAVREANGKPRFDTV